jgi:hypothetical protein
MTNTLLILLGLAVLVKFILVAFVIHIVFKDDIRQYREQKEEEKKAGVAPVCMYCGSAWTHATDEGQTRWENDELILVTTYECEHCTLPFWHVERVPMIAHLH